MGGSPKNGERGGDRGEQAKTLLGAPSTLTYPQYQQKPYFFWTLPPIVSPFFHKASKKFPNFPPFSPILPKSAHFEVSVLVPPPPPAPSKHVKSQKNDGQAGSCAWTSPCLQATRGTKRTYVAENLPVPQPIHNCCNRAPQHYVQHFSASCPSGGIRSWELWNRSPFQPCASS